MLGLELRAEFKGRRLKGTAIELTDDNNTGATQITAAEFLRITYPSNDVLKTIEAAGPGQGRPITLKGERGQGKSHLMAALYHALTDQAATQHWLNQWSHTLGDVKISQISLRGGVHVISDSLHRQRYKYLWDLLFDNHPHGGYCRGKWEGLGAKKTDVPSDEILLELFRHTPTALILDEFQTWYDGLADTRQERRQTWAFNFIQILSEIAARHPDLLLLVVSVRNGHTDAFQQIQRVNPVIVDFSGPSAKRDRLRLLLHRLFENRLQVPLSAIEGASGSHINEYFRLKDIAPAEQARLRAEFLEAWPYAPHLMDLLEDQVLIATSAQGTRDLIRILADLYKRHGAKQPILTAADFRLDDEASGITALLASVANQHHANLREKALRNLEAVESSRARTRVTSPRRRATCWKGPRTWTCRIGLSCCRPAGRRTLGQRWRTATPLPNGAAASRSWCCRMHRRSRARCSAHGCATICNPTATWSASCCRGRAPRRCLRIGTSWCSPAASTWPRTGSGRTPSTAGTRLSTSTRSFVFWLSVSL